MQAIVLHTHLDFNKIYFLIIKMGGGQSAIIVIVIIVLILGSLIFLPILSGISGLNISGQLFASIPNPTDIINEGIGAIIKYGGEGIDAIGKIPSSIEKSAKKTGKSIEKSANKTGKSIKKAFKI